MITALESAQIALGKFYLHRWEGQVLVDWATSMVAQGFDQDNFKALASMEGANRSAQLDQFIRTCNGADIQVQENIELAIRSYVEDLQRRALADEIELEAAFAQLRPLAYDNTSVVIPGLEELDEDFNLLDSGQATFHYPDLKKGNKKKYLRSFFEALSVSETSFANTRDPRDIVTDMPPQPESDFARYVEMTAIICITLVFVVYVLLLLVGFMAEAMPS